MKIAISSTGCSPHVDFDIHKQTEGNYTEKKEKRQFIEGRIKLNQAPVNNVKINFSLVRDLIKVSEELSPIKALPSPPSIEKPSITYLHGFRLVNLNPCVSYCTVHPH